MYTGGSDEQETGAAAETSRTSEGDPGGALAAATPDGRGDDQGSFEDRSSALDQAFLSGRRDPATYCLADEPLSRDADVDWRYLYEIIREQTEREENRGRALDTTVTALLGGVVAFIGFSLRASESEWSAAAALLYFIPLLVLGQALLTKRGERAPSVESLRTYFPTYPVSTLKQGVDSMLLADAANENINNRKAARIELAAILTGLVTTIILITQVAFAIVNTSPNGSHLAHPASAPTKPALITPGKGLLRPE